MFTLPPLPYALDALEPYYGSETLRRHYYNHHAGYVAKLNSLLSEEKNLIDKTPDWILENPLKMPGNLRDAVIHNAGAHANHSFFWNCMTPLIDPRKHPVVEEISKTFDGLNNFQSEFTEKATDIKGSGWVWLVKDGKKLKIISTENQGSLLSDRRTPVLVLDVYEHSYIYTHINDKAAYVKSFFNIINWAFVNENFLAAP